MKGEYLGKGTIQFGQMLDGKFVATGLPQVVAELRVGPPADVGWLPDETWDEGERPISLAKERATALKCSGHKRVTIHLGPGAFYVRDLQKLIDACGADTVTIQGQGSTTRLVGGVQGGDGRVPEDVLESIRKLAMGDQEEAFARLGEVCRRAFEDFEYLHRKELAEIVSAPSKHKQPFWTNDWRKGGRR